jgi:hypothetical protein
MGAPMSITGAPGEGPMRVGIPGATPRSGKFNQRKAEMN